MITKEPTDKSKYVLLRSTVPSESGLLGLRPTIGFITLHDPAVKDYSEKNCEVLGYSETIRDAQIKLFGRSYTDRDD